MKGETAPIEFHYTGFAVLLALLIGGGTEQGLWSDHLIEFALLPAAILGFASLPANRWSGAAKALALLTVALCAWQFVPFSRPWPTAADPAAVSVLFSPAPGRSLEAAVFLLTMLGFALYIARFAEVDQERMTRFFLMGLVVNAAIGVVQLSFAREEGLSGVLPYVISSAIFANENHLSAFVVATIPLLAWRFLGVSRQFWSFLAAIAALLILLFAVGSRAGMAISVGVALLMILWFATTQTHPYLKGGLALAALVGTFAAMPLLHVPEALDADLRSVFFRNTMTAISAHWPLGSGMGTFLPVYPLYEQVNEIQAVYANQAHNDFLQILLETGAAGAALMAGFLVLAVRGMAGSKLAQAAFIGVSALLLHSVVDYPLRTAAVAVTFAFFAGILLSRPDPARQIPQAP